MDDKYINATALLEQMPEVPYKGSLRRVLMQAPAADVQPVRHGRYITDDMGDSSCSECGAKWLDVTQNYCPNCGADMREVDE